MSQKTRQLQVRVSPEQKGLLKKLAGASGMSVSEYVLAAALPSASGALKRHVDALPDMTHRHKALLELRTDLSRIPTHEFDETAAGVEVRGLPLLQQALAAAAFEHEAQLRGCAPPSWTRSVPVAEDPSFRPRLPSLRPYLLCAAPPALKRRNVFMLWDERSPDGRTRPRHPAPAPRNEHEERLARLGEELHGRGVAAELCLVGGAVIPFVFHANPESRRPGALLASGEHLAAATDQACPELDTTWVNRAALHVTRISEARFYAGPNLSVLEPPAGYVLAMKCLTIAWGSGQPRTTDRDLSYLIRFLGLSQPDAALERIATYLNDRQMPTDLATRLSGLM